MLSSEHLSVPSCSSKAAAAHDPALRSDQEKVNRTADPVEPNTKFSIRDYVFASRSKGIKNSWPFRPQSLLLCLKRGVKDILPPFEPPDLVRAESFGTRVHIEQFVACSEAGAHVDLLRSQDAGSSNASTSDIKCRSRYLEDDLLCGSLDQSRYPSPEDGKSTVDQGGNTDESIRTDELTPAVLLDNSTTEVSREIEEAVPTEKKCRLVVKLSSLTDNRRADDLVSNSSTVSDTMASKTCPVCKVFASTSNTTLNAHIDQCLSVESNTEQVETVFLKPKVKPRKKRLMVDIYKTALPFTLEDLDRRNGTNWAAELALTAVNKEVCAENRSPDMLPLEPRNDEREGAVYVDSNGIKIRILSKSNDAPLVLRDELGSRKIAKHEQRKSILISKKKFQPKYSKHKKFKAHGKKYNKLKLANGQVQSHWDGDTKEDTDQEEQPASRMPGATENAIHSGSIPIRQWACSKRSDLAKKLSRNGTNGTLGNLVPATARKLARRSKLDSDDSRMLEEHVQTFSRSSEEMPSSSEANMVHAMDDQRKDSPKQPALISRWASKATSGNGLTLKLCRSSEPSVKRKIVETVTGDAYRRDSSNMMTSSSSEKNVRLQGLSLSLVGSRDDLTQEPTTMKKFRKHRSPMRTGRREAVSPVSGVAHGFVDDHEAVIRHANKKLRTNNFNTSRSLARPRLEDTVDDDHSCGSDVPESEQGEDHYNMAEQENAGMASPPVEYENGEPETEMRFDALAAKTGADDPLVTASLNLENETTVHRTVLAEAHREAKVQRSSGEQLMHHVRVISNMVPSEDIRACQADPVATKESSACLTSNRDTCLEAPQDNSSITSNREDSNHDRDSAFDRDSSDSPVSTASTMLLPTTTDPNIKESEPGPSTANVQSTEEGNTRSSNQETEQILPAREYEQLSGDKPFCCSCRESLSRESQLLRQNATARTLPDFKGKKVPQLYIGPRASSSFSLYQRTSTKANASLDSQEQSFVAKASSESTMSAPAYANECSSLSLQTQLPSPSNPILRLMGKNLMVMNSEESAHPQASAPDYIMRENCMTPLGFVPPNYTLKPENSLYHHLGDPAFVNWSPSMASRQIPLHNVQAGGFAGNRLQNGPMAQRNLVPLMHPAYMMKELIMIDDSSENRSDPKVSVLLPAATQPTTISVSSPVAPRPFFCYPSPRQILPRHATVGSTPMLTNIGPMVSVSSTNQGSTPDVAGPFMPNPFLVQSPTSYLSPPMFYPQNLR